MDSDDPHDLQRFLEAQERSYNGALAEIRAGRKTSHWMWYVFPQLHALGRSPTAQLFGITDLAEARAYLAQEVLGPRLAKISRAMLLHQGTSPEHILGPVDAMKLRSSMTLFEAAGAGPFAEVLEAFYAGARCPLTLEALA